MTMFERLAAPFDQSAVHWRPQGTPYERDGQYSVMALAYIDARDVMDRLDEVCGPQFWQTSYHETAKGRLICNLSICFGGEWITKADGAGDTDVEGEKGAISDALKRAAVSWGIGRYLYRMGSPWVPCEVSKKGDKVYWKGWKVDPWSKVKQPPAASKLAPIEQAKDAGEQAKDNARDPVAVADGIITVFSKAETLAILEAIAADGTKAAKAWDWLELEFKDQAARVRMAYDARAAELTQQGKAA